MTSSLAGGEESTSPPASTHAATGTPPTSRSTPSSTTAPSTPSSLSLPVRFAPTSIASCRRRRPCSPTMATGPHTRALRRSIPSWPSTSPPGGSSRRLSPSSGNGSPSSCGTAAAISAQAVAGDSQSGSRVQPPGFGKVDPIAGGIVKTPQRALVGGRRHHERNRPQRPLLVILGASQVDSQLVVRLVLAADTARDLVLCLADRLEAQKVGEVVLAGARHRRDQRDCRFDRLDKL